MPVHALGATTVHYCGTYAMTTSHLVAADHVTQAVLTCNTSFHTKQEHSSSNGATVAKRVVECTATRKLLRFEKERSPTAVQMEHGVEPQRCRGIFDGQMLLVSYAGDSSRHGAHRVA